MIFGASGDLASRYLFPALAELWEAGQLPTDLRIRLELWTRQSDPLVRRLT